MIAHIIHDPRRRDRFKLLNNEAVTQGFQYQLWQAQFGLTPIEGCHRAHNLIVAEAHRQHAAYVLIMEDDVQFTSAHAFEYFIRNMPADFDIYTAGGYGVFDYDAETKRISHLSGTHCYIVHSKFFLTYLNMDLTEYSDKAITDSGAHIQMVYPMCALQYAGHSDILDQYVDYNSERFINHPTFKL